MIWASVIQAGWSHTHTHTQSQQQVSCSVLLPHFHRSTVTGCGPARFCCHSFIHTCFFFSLKCFSIMVQQSEHTHRSSQRCWRMRWDYWGSKQSRDNSHSHVDMTDVWQQSQTSRYRRLDNVPSRNTTGFFFFYFFRLTNHKETLVAFLKSFLF